MTYYSYSDPSAGPFNSNAAPPMDATLMNAIRDLLLHVWADSNMTSDHNGVLTLLGLIVSGAIQPNVSPSSLSGSTSGTATLWMPFQGTFKLVIVFQGNFKNGGGSTQTMSLPTGFTYGCLWKTTSTNTFSLRSGGSARTLNIDGSSPATTAGGSQSGDCVDSWDTLAFSSGAATAHTGWMFFLGS